MSDNLECDRFECTTIIKERVKIFLPHQRNKFVGELNPEIIRMLKYNYISEIEKNPFVINICK